MFRLVRPLALTLFGVLAAAGSAQFYDFNGGGNGFTSSFNTAPFDGPWEWGASAGVGGSGGWSTEGQVGSIGHPCTTDLTSPSVNVPVASPVTLRFDHRHSFEVGGVGNTIAWDGGALFMSVNGGAFTYVPGSNFVSNGYNRLIEIWALGSELGGLMAFGDASAGYANGAFITSVVNLGNFNAGDSIRIRFRAAFDENTSAGSPDWAIDNVGFAMVPEPVSVSSLVVGLAWMLRLRRSR